MTGTDRHTCRGNRDPPAKERGAVSQPAAGRGRADCPPAWKDPAHQRLDLDLQLPRAHCGVEALRIGNTQRPSTNEWMNIPFKGSNPNPTHPLVWKDPGCPSLLSDSSPRGPSPHSLEGRPSGPSRGRLGSTSRRLCSVKPLTGSEMISSWGKQRAGDSVRSF